MSEQQLSHSLKDAKGKVIMSKAFRESDSYLAEGSYWQNAGDDSEETLCLDEGCARSSQEATIPTRPGDQIENEAQFDADACQSHPYIHFLPLEYLFRISPW